MQHAPVQIYVLPSQPKQLPLPEPERQREHVEGLKAVACYRRREPPCLVRLEDRRLLLLNPWTLSSIRRVANQAEASVLDRRSEALARKL